MPDCLEGYCIEFQNVAVKYKQYYELQTGILLQYHRRTVQQQQNRQVNSGKW